MGSIDLIFDNIDAIFFPGQEIKGVLLIHLTQISEVKGVCVEFNGSAEVCFGNKQNFESYYQEEILLFGDGFTHSIVQAGTYVYNFNFLVPKDALGSIESLKGYIRHYCRAKVILQDESSTIKKIFPYSVISILDLNPDYHTRIPASISDTKSYYITCLCGSGTTTISLSLDRSGYVSGDTIIITASCYNRSKNIISKTAALLIQRMSYRTKSSTFSVEKNVVEVVRGEVPKNSATVWTKVPMKVPAVPVTNFHGASLINVEYFLAFRIYPAGMYNDFEIKVPIIIGNVPLKETFTTFISNPTNLSVVKTPPYGSSHQMHCFPPAQEYANIPRPNYLESITSEKFINENVYDSAYSLVDWRPKYATFQTHLNLSSSLHM